MSMEWSDEARRACFGTCGGAISQHAPHEDIGCSMFEDTLRYLGPLVAAREAQAVRKAADMMRRHWVPGSGLFTDPLDSETAYTPDVWLDRYAERYERADAEEAGR